METITLKKLLRGSSTRLGLTGQAGDVNLTKRVSRIQVFSNVHLHPALPAWLKTTILVMDRVSAGQYGDPRSEGCREVLENIARAEIPCLALAGVASLPDYMFQFAARTAPHVVCSRFDEDLLAGRLQGLLREKIRQRLFMQGALVNVQGLGVLITGLSGSGKTTWALELAGRGHKWVADDAVEIEKRGADRLYGRSHVLVRNLVEIKGRGVIPVGELLPAAALADETSLDLIVEIKKGCGIAPLIVNRGARRIMGVRLPLLGISSFSAGCNSRELEKAADIIRGAG